MKKHQKEIILSICCLILGLILGVFSKYSDIAPAGGIKGDLLTIFKDLSSNLTIWIIFSTFISLLSKKPWLASLNVLLFLGSMLLSYYFYSAYYVQYFYKGITIYWLKMLIPSSLLAYLIWHIKNDNLLGKILKFGVYFTIPIISIKEFISNSVVSVLVIEIIFYFILIYYMKRGKL